MFGKSRPVVFDPYPGRRGQRRVPRWLLLLLLGTATGAAAVLFVQDRYLPPRLSAGASAELRQAFAKADAERQQLQTELASTRQRLDASTAGSKKLNDELEASRSTVAALRDDLKSVVAALPPDPRNGRVEVRAANLSVEDGGFAYEVVLTRGGTAAKPLPGLLQFTLAGENVRGNETSIALKPVALSLGGQQVLRGTLPMPDGFKPRQATVQVLDRSGGNALGMRVMLVRASG